MRGFAPSQSGPAGDQARRGRQLRAARRRGNPQPEGRPGPVRRGVRAPRNAARSAPPSPGTRKPCAGSRNPLLPPPRNTRSACCSKNNRASNAASDAYERMILNYPHSTDFNAALEAEYRIGTLYLDGLRQHLLGIPLLPQRAEGGRRSSRSSRATRPSAGSRRWRSSASASRSPTPPTRRRPSRPTRSAWISTRPTPSPPTRSTRSATRT